MGGGRGEGEKYIEQNETKWEMMAGFPILGGLGGEDGRIVCISFGGGFFRVL